MNQLAAQYAGIGNFPRHTSQRFNQLQNLLPVTE